MTLSADDVRSILDYNQETGIFTWKIRARSTRPVGSVAGCFRKQHGDIVIGIKGKIYLAHRLAWLWVHGSWPNHDIDHINGNSFDNRIANLRLASNAQNQANRRRNKGKRVPKGVRATPNGKFQARISVSKRQIHLGTFVTEQAAADAYMRAAKQHYGNFARAS